MNKKNTKKELDNIAHTAGQIAGNSGVSNSVDKADTFIENSLVKSNSSRQEIIPIADRPGSLNNTIDRLTSNINEVVQPMAEKGLKNLADNFVTGAKALVTGDYTKEQMIDSAIDTAKIAQQPAKLLLSLPKAIFQEAALFANKGINEGLATVAPILSTGLEKVGLKEDGSTLSRKELIELYTDRLYASNQNNKAADLFLPERANNKYLSYTDTSQQAAQVAEDFGGNKFTQGVFATTAIAGSIFADAPTTGILSSLKKGWRSAIKRIEFEKIISSVDDDEIRAFTAKNLEGATEDVLKQADAIIKESNTVSEAQDKLIKLTSVYESENLVKQSEEFAAGGRVQDVIDSARKEQAAADALNKGQELFDTQRALKESVDKKARQQAIVEASKKRSNTIKDNVRKLTQERDELIRKNKISPKADVDRARQQRLAQVNEELKDLKKQRKIVDADLANAEKEIKKLSDDVNELRNKKTTAKDVELVKDANKASEALGRKKVLQNLRRKLQNQLQEVKDLFETGDISKETFENKTSTIIDRIADVENKIGNVKVAPKALSTFQKGKAVVTKQSAKLRTKLFGYKEKEALLEKEIKVNIPWYEDGKLTTKEIKLSGAIDRTTPINKLQMGEEFVSDATDVAGRLSLYKSKIRNLNTALEKTQKRFGEMFNRAYGSDAKLVAADLENYLLNKRAIEIIDDKGQSAININRKTAQKFVDQMDAKYAGDRVWENSNKIIRNTNKEQLTKAYKDGFISREEYLKILETGENYVPLYDDVGNNINPSSVEIKQLNSNIDAFKNGEGLTANVIDSTFAKAQKSNNSSVQNEVRKAFGNFILNSKQSVITKQVDDAGKKLFSVKEISRDTPVKSGALTYFDDGKKYVITAPDNYISAFGSPTSNDKFLPSLSNKILNFQGKMLTVNSPSFQIKSFVRDGLETLNNAASMVDDVKSGIIGQARSESVNAFKAISDLNRGVDTPNAIYAREYLYEAGGIAGGKSTTLNYGTKSKFSEVVQEGKVPTFENFQDATREITKKLEINARLSAFIDARKKGYSVLEAGALAQEAGVNFTKSGWLTDMAQPFYLFFNATIQGNAATLRAWKRSPATFAKAHAALALSVGTQETVNSVVAGDDWKDYIPSSVLSTNLVFIINVDEEGNPIYIKVPIPQIMAGQKNLLENGVDYSKQMVDGKERVGLIKALTEPLKLTAESLAPVGGSTIGQIGDGGDVLKSIALSANPDTLDPILQNIINQNNFGSEIYDKETIQVENKSGTLEDKTVLESDPEFGNKDIGKGLANLISKLLSPKDKQGQKLVNNEAAIYNLLKGYILLGDINSGVTTASELKNAITDGDQIDLDKISGVKTLFGSTPSDDTTVGFSKGAELEKAISAADSPATAREIMAEGLVAGAYATKESREKTGFTVSDTLIGNSMMGALLAEKYLTITDDPEFEAERAAAIEKIRDEYNEDKESFGAVKYKNLVYHLAGREGMWQQSDSAIKKYFEDNGIILETNKDGSVKSSDKNTMYEMYFASRRIPYPKAEIEYNRLDGIIKTLEGNTTAEDLEAFRQRYLDLYDSGFAGEETVKKKYKSFYNKAFNNNKEYFIDLLDKDFDINGIRTDIRLNYDPAVGAWFENYLKDNGY